MLSHDMYIYICIYIYIFYLYLYILFILEIKNIIHMHTCTYIYICVCVCLHLYLNIYVFTHSINIRYKYKSICMYISTFIIYLYIVGYTCLYLHVLYIWYIHIMLYFLNINHISAIAETMVLHSPPRKAPRCLETPDGRCTFSRQSQGSKHGKFTM